jgi:hypothetical protein
MTNWSDYIRAVFDDKTWPNHLKPGLLAWAALESGRCTTDVSKYAYNAHSMMWRAELGALYPNKYRFEGNDYFRFNGFKQELECLYQFIHRAVYGNVSAHMTSIEDLLTFIGHSFCPPGYQDWWIARHLNCNYHQYIVKWMLPEAEDCLKILGWRPDVDQPAPQPVPIPAPQPAPTTTPFSVSAGRLGGPQVTWHPVMNDDHWQRPATDTIVVHATGCLRGKGASGNYPGILDGWNDPRGYSAHLLILRDGTVWQAVDLRFPSWNCYHQNSHTIGVELENIGPFWPWQNILGRFFRFKGKLWEQSIGANELVKGSDGQLYQFYTSSQIDVLNGIIPALKSAFPTIKYVKGHREMPLNTTWDPGPKDIFPWSIVKGEEGIVHS